MSRSIALVLSISIVVLFFTVTASSTSTGRIYLEPPLKHPPANWRLVTDFTLANKSSIVLPLQIFIKPNVYGISIIADIAEKLNNPTTPNHFRTFYSNREMSTVLYPTDRTLVSIRDWFDDEKLIRASEFFQMAQQSLIFNSVQIPNLTITQIEQLLHCRFDLYQNIYNPRLLTLRTLSYTVPEGFDEFIDFITPTMHFDHAGTSPLNLTPVTSTNLKDSANRPIITTSDIIDQYHISNDHKRSIKPSLKLMISGNNAFQCNQQELLSFFVQKKFNSVDLLLDQTTLHYQDIITKSSDQFVTTAECSLVIQWIASLVQHDAIIETNIPSFTPLSQLLSENDQTNKQQYITWLTKTFHLTPEEQQGDLFSLPLFVELQESLPQTIFHISFDYLEQKSSYNPDGSRYIPTKHELKRQQLPNTIMLTTSYDETDVSPVFLERMHRELQKLAAVGVTVITSTGEYGSHLANVKNIDLTSHKPQKRCKYNHFFPATSPYILPISAVGMKPQPVDSEKNNNDQINLSPHPLTIPHVFLATGTSESQVFHTPSYESPFLEYYYQHATTVTNRGTVPASMSFNAQNCVFSHHNLNVFASFTDLCSTTIATAVIFKINQFLYNNPPKQSIDFIDLHKDDYIRSLTPQSLQYLNKKNQVLRQIGNNTLIFPLPAALSPSIEARSDQIDPDIQNIQLLGAPRNALYHFLSAPDSPQAVVSFYDATSGHNGGCTADEGGAERLFSTNTNLYPAIEHFDLPSGFGVPKYPKLLDILTTSELSKE